MILKVTLNRRFFSGGVLLVVAALSGIPAHARVRHGEAWARERFATAERMREALNGRPPAERTRHDYQRVVNAYRNVYYGAPTSTKADPSAVAVAETLVEMGRRFEDDNILHEAVEQYKFLRKEYPGSKYRCDALFTIGEIYKDDLDDPEEARATFEEFLKRYPHNRLVEDAQQAILELKNQSADKKAQAEKDAESEKKAEVRPGGGIGDKPKAAAQTPSAAQEQQEQKTSESRTEAASTDAAGSASSEPRGHRLPRVTAIRHWSTPDYTRVAIDVESEVKFGSSRIPGPERIFFDLRDTMLASTLVGKSFEVDDGFLKKIRVAQFKPGRTRVVLEVDSLSTYEAFLLPNPYRLIIDIHGKNDKIAHAKLTKEEAAALADVEVPPAAEAKSSVPKPVMKADMKALAGKPATKKEEIHDQNSEKDEAAGPPDAEDSPKAESAKTAPPVKKVIVDNDDDADSSATAKNESRAPRSSARDRKSNSADERSPAEQAMNDVPAPRHVKAKTSSRLTASRKDPDVDIRVAKPTASGDRSLIRTLGLKIGKIVIDPGHGGHDTGTIGPEGLKEKDLVLEVGRRLGKLLETRLGAEVVYTRKDDTFIPLETRTAIANQQRADLFISIHANSSEDPDARGVETYYLNFTSSPEALEVAARENAVSEKSIYELQDLVKKIALKEKIEESREFAADVQQSLHSGLAARSPGIRNRGVKKAPFIVLIGANMPSILAEISFVSNPGDEHRLETSEYRQRIAESLYRGIAKYVDGLSGVKMASKLDKTAGQ